MLYKNTANVFKSKRIIMLILFILIFIVPIFLLFSCREITGDNDTGETNAPDDVITPISYINASNDGIKEQSVSDLYNKVELSELKRKTLNADRFNLKLSHNNYFYTDDIYVEITSDIADDDIKIYYTLNGSTPQNGVENRSNRLYEEPFLLEKSDNNTPYVLKVIAFSESTGTRSRMLTHTYFVSSQIENRFSSDNLYIFSISSDPRNLFDHDYGILVEGRLREEWQEANPGRWADPPEPANYNIRGREGEREAYVEIFKSNGQLIVSQGAGLRVRGGWSRAASKKSLGLFARNDYDKVFDRFYYPFFEGKTRYDEFGTYVCDYKTLLLRNGANDREGSNMREEFTNVLAKKAGLPDYKDAAPAAVFLNGEYYGFMWLQIYYDETYFTDIYGGDDKNAVEQLEWAEPDQSNAGKLIDDEAFYEYSENVLDLDNYMLYYALQIYGSNWDWPHNNRKYWRYAGGDGTDISKYYDGKYRALFYDAEGGWGLYGNGYRTRDVRRMRDGGAPVFMALMRRGDMVEKFCNQMFDLINTVFEYDSVYEVYQQIVDLYDDEITVSIKKKVISDWYNLRQLENERNHILNFARNRADIVIQDMVSSLKISSDRVYYVSATGKDGADITLNTLKLSGAGKISSCYFTDHTIKITAKPYPGKVFDKWIINGKEYNTPEVVLRDSLAVNGRIDAELFLKTDESYAECVFNRIRLDDDCDIIELYNPGNAEAIIENVYISNDINDLQRFYIKKVTFPPNTSIMYYGMNYYKYVQEYNKNSKDNKIEQINANRVFDFKISPGDTIYISSVTGEILNSINIPKRYNPGMNETIARQPDGAYRVIKE